MCTGSAAWGDCDNDGDPDLLLTGEAVGRVPTAKVYLNQGGTTFTEIVSSLEPVLNSSAAWAEYDNDSDLDVLLAGEPYRLELLDSLSSTFAEPVCVTALDWKRVAGLSVRLLLLE